ncbi:MAG: cytochrome b/b6 domain-containing protein [Sulfitobacter sp.]
MALTNTAQRYGGITKTFHWATALLIITLLPLGLYANDLPYDTSEELARKAWFFSLHKTLGVTAFFVALGRIIWAFSQPKPGLLNADHKVESFAAELVHWLLYGALIIVPLSGWIGHAAAAGFAPIWWPFGQDLPLIPKSTGVEHFFAALHWIATKVLAASLLLHIAGALKHHVIDRDATLRRMLPGEPAIGPLPDQHHTNAPLIGALAVWGLAIALGGMLAAQSGETQNASGTTLSDVTSDWQVQEGVVEITVVQFGSEVTGTFADWTAAISFDETIPNGKVGSVTATINVASLTLGSVTQQALGADFFDATTHPTAVFKADIQHAADGYEAIGTLTIKDNSMPLTLPFGLAVEGDNAEMRSDLTLDRRTFGIGDNMKDADSLAFEVKVRITLKAQRGA